MEKSYMLLANGFEEIEALATLDMLRRAGIDVITASIHTSTQVTGAHNITVSADTLLSSLPTPLEAQYIILPGGMPGAQNLADNPQVRQILLHQNLNNRNIAAICASPAVVLAPLGILDNRNATCYPGFENALTNATYCPDTPVITDHNITTAQGPGATFAFATAIIENLKGHDTADNVAAGMLIH